MEMPSLVTQSSCAIAAASAETLPDSAGFEATRYIAEVRRLSAPNGLRSTVAIASQWAAIAIAVYFATRLQTVWAYTLAIVFIGTRQNALLVLLHEAVHFSLFRNRRLNDLIANLFLGFPCQFSLVVYRRLHWDHHRFTNTEKDPDFQFHLKMKEMRWPKTPRDAALTFLKDLSGLNVLQCLGLYIGMSPWREVFSKKGEGALSTQSSRTLFLGFMAALVTAIALTHSLNPFLLLWVIPALWILPFLLRLRAIADHVGAIGNAPVDRTRTIRPHPIERHLFYPFGVHYHLEHHLFPSVPFFGLPRLHAVLSQDSDFRRRAPLYASYFGRNGVFPSLTTPRPPSERSAYGEPDHSPV